MTEEKQKLLDKINNQIQKKKNDLLNALPIVHSVEDGIVIRFFLDWEHCEENKKIRYMKIDCDDPHEVRYNFFLPKGTILDIKKREYAGCITCLSGELELDVNGKVVHFYSHTKKCLDSDIFQGRVIKDSYIVTEANEIV